MKILAIQPGASYSTHDVYTGIVGALSALGHEVYPYRLDGRIAVAGAWLKYITDKVKRQGGEASYTPGDVIYKASAEAVERALRLQPDWVLVVSGMYFHPDVFILLRRAGLRVAVLLTESPYDEAKEAKILPYVDLAWTNERTCVPRLRQVNPNVYYLPHAYDPSKHYPGEREGDAELPAHDVVFVGTYFQERVELLSAVNWDGIDLGLYGDASVLGSRSRLRQYVRGGVTENTRTAGLYRRAKIGLNLHRTSIGFGKTAPRIAHAESLNPRAYELAASGCFQISDYRQEFAERFSVWGVTFESAQDLEYLIRHYMHDPEARQFKADQMCQLIQGETFEARARQLVADLERVSRPLTATG